MGRSKVRSTSPTSPIYSHPTAASSTHSILLSHPIDYHSDSGASISRAATTEIGCEVRGRSLTPVRGSPMPSTQPNNAQESTAKLKIRFAELPVARPRSYSTGRNVWLEPDRTWSSTDSIGSEIMTIGDKRGFIHRHQIENDPIVSQDDSAISTDDEGGSGDASSSSRSRAHHSSSLFTAERWGLEGNTSYRSDKSSSESYTVKLLRPLSFGLVKPKQKRIAQSPSSDSVSNQSLKDYSEAEVGRRSGSPLGRHDDPPGGETLIAVVEPSIVRTGVPMSRPNTWDGNLAETTSFPRRHYPSVVQRSRRKPPPPVEVEPKFVEWGMRSVSGSGGGGMGSNNRKTTSERKNPDQDEEEEGSGLAWIKRRKQERLERAAVEAAKIKRENLKAEEEELARLSMLEKDGQSLSTPSDSGTTTPTIASQDSRSIPSASSTSPIFRSVISPSTAESLQSHAIDTAGDEVEDEGDFSSGDERDRGELEEEDDDEDLDPEELAREESLRNEARPSALAAGAEKFSNRRASQSA